MKRTVPLVITFLGGFILLISYFIPYTQGWGENVSVMFDILAAIAFVLGGGNLLKMHLKKVSDRAKGWGFSAVTVVAFAITLYVGLFKVGAPAAEMFPAQKWSAQVDAEGGAFWYIYEYILRSLTATMFSMLAFYVASAAFRAFRAKNIEAILLLLTAFVILLGRTYAGTFLTGWMPGWMSFLKTETLTLWIMSVFNTAGSRAIMIGIALGLVSTSLKVMLAVDRSYLGSD
jgi:hypothetical protein